MAEEQIDFNKLIDPLSKFYGLEMVTQAIIALNEWYLEEAYDKSDRISDWESGYEDCAGIEKLVEWLQVDQLSNNQNYGEMLYSHCCYHLLPDQAMPTESPPFETAKPTQNNNTSIRIKQTDTALARYYDILNKPYDSLFAMFCTDNGLDDDAVDAEMIESAQDCILIEFDKDFPFKEAYSTQQEKQELIYQIIAKCYTNPDIVFGVETPQLNKAFFEINNEEFNDIEEIYKTQCRSIYEAGLNNTWPPLLRLLAIGKKNNIKYLSNLLDDYYRTRVKNIDLALSEEKWFEQHPHKKEIENISITGYDDAKTHKITEIILDGIQSFSRNIFPKLLFAPIINIDDSLEITVRYIIAALESIGQLIKTHTNNDIDPFPFHTDLCIAYKKSISIEIAVSMPSNIWDDEDDEDDDDDDDDGDDIDDDDEWKDSFHTKFVGDIPKKLHKHNIKYENTQLTSNNVVNIIADVWFREIIHIYGPMDVINLIINFCGQINQFMPTAELFNDLYTKFINHQKKGETYPKYKRLVTFIDRRHGTRNNDDGNVDEIWMYEPNHCQNIPNDVEIAELWYLNASRTCLLPNIESYNNDMDDLYDTDRNNEQCSFYENIGTANHCKGTLLTLSVHAKCIDEIKCYLYWNGGIMRFMPNDIMDVLPTIFYKQWNNDKKLEKDELSLNQQFINDKELNQLLIKKISHLIKDKYFNTFQYLY